MIYLKKTNYHWSCLLLTEETIIALGSLYQGKKKKKKLDICNLRTQDITRDINIGLTVFHPQKF